MGAVRQGFHLPLLVIAVGLCTTGHAANTFQEGDTFVGQFEMGGLADDNYFVLRAHSPQHGAFTWLTGVGHAPGWMTHCTPPDSCAGGPLVRPIFGTLNVVGRGTCTDSNSCTAPPAVQPGTGCVPYGCQVEGCGCDRESGEGCWGLNFNNTIVLIQRGESVGEGASKESCTFGRKIFNAENAGASAVIVFNNLPYAAVYMAADSKYTNLTIPAVFVTRDAGLLLWEMINDANLTGGVDVSLTNQTENSMRLTITSVEQIGAAQSVYGDVEFRLEDGGLENVTNNEAFPYGSFRVMGTAIDDTMTLRPMCQSNAKECAYDKVLWNRQPQFALDEIQRRVPFGLQLAVRSAEQDDIHFEHMFGNIVDLAGNHDKSATAKLRRVPPCAAEIAYVLDCLPAAEDDKAQQCLQALDDKGYRHFNDNRENGLAPLFWYCQHAQFCAGDYLTRPALKRLEAQSLPALPAACEAGTRGGYVYLGANDWGADESLHLCGYGDRTRQHGVCNKLPADPLSNSPSGWYFNTSCKVKGEGEECGHSGWFMEGGYIASCTGGADCDVDDSESSLDLHIKLATTGTLVFTYTAHGEQFFDYMTFSVNDKTVHHTQTWWTTGEFLQGVAVGLPAGEHKLSWSWVKDWSLSGGNDKATLHEILITGTASDDECNACPAGFCGNGGLRGCDVCPRAMKAPSPASTQCEPCGMSPEGTVYTGPERWPQEGNTQTCQWGCTKGFCSSEGGTSACSSTTSCPPNKCCPHRGQCYLPTVEQVADGEWPVTMEMLRNCLDLTPLDSDVASATQSVVRSFLDRDGFYPWFSQTVSAGKSRGSVVVDALNAVLQDANNNPSGVDPISLLPEKTDWSSLHAPLIKAARDTLDIDLSYLPSSFYQEISFFLPWKFAYGIQQENCLLPNGCWHVTIQGMNSAVTSMGWWRTKGKNGWYAQPCDCLTCSCAMKQRRAEAYIGWTVVGLDYDNTGVSSAAKRLQEWADAHAMGDNAGARLMYALSSGEEVDGRVGVPGMRNSAGQFGCSFASRNLGVCQMPTCTDTFCHIRVQLAPPPGLDAEKETLDVPWTVAHHPHGQGEFDGAGEVVCAENLFPPFDKNVACMKQAIVDKYAYGSTEEGFAGVPAPQCDGGTHVRGLRDGRPYPVFHPLPSFAASKKYDTCQRPASHWGMGYAGLSALGSPERAAAAMVLVDPANMAQTGVLTLRSFKEEELALHSVLEELAARKPADLLLDLRGNVGGELCHVFELAYIVSDAFKSPEDAQRKLAMHLRHSKSLDTAVYTDIILNAQADGKGLSNVCSVDEKDGEFACKGRGADLRWYYCGGANLCAMGRLDCPVCPKIMEDDSDEWTLPFRPLCNGKDTSSLLSFNPLKNCPNSGQPWSHIFKTPKICPNCVGPDCEAQGHCGYDKMGLTILADGRCVGACAMFVELMHKGGYATIVAPRVGDNLTPYQPAGGLGTSAKDWWCAVSAAEGDEATANPSLERFGKPLPLLGQNVLFPIAAVRFADEEKSTRRIIGKEGEVDEVEGVVGEVEAEGGMLGLGGLFATQRRSDPSGAEPLKFPGLPHGPREVRMFDMSERAHDCATDLYAEAMAAAAVCAIDSVELNMDVLAMEFKMNCSLPHTTVARRVCNSTCTHHDLICKQWQEIGNAAQELKDQAVCKPLCWSQCSAIECEEGAFKLWDGFRHLCFKIEPDTLYSTDFRIGNAWGHMGATNEAKHKWGWRAALSG
eukprot:CAMPEP_0181300836 /NCGR_PEP_ID=MMETSP1101-20121128/7101_1 /TAXON_ID=46948 /ORGANISM="Rhodomonas abbreviata, Strain Caron Lab Isolate" /LENGTH=1721 /DNA_ID=CAMNT_0023406097 /DNA_START=152 /DNA_END=5313 /DNA_ORIENTATION=+